MEIKKVYEVCQKWLNIEDLDRIDLMLAVALTSRTKGTRLWVLFVGASGDGKSELVNALDDGGLHTYLLHKLTSKTLVSGNKKAQDLAPKLKDKLLIISDFAEILTLPVVEKASVWGQMRELYDGRAGGDFGSGVSANYKDLNVTMIGCSTPAIDNQMLIHQSLGTRELIYRTKGNNALDKLNKMIRHNLKAEEEMRMEIRTAIQNFLLETEYKHIEVDDDIADRLFKFAKYLCDMRSQADIDFSTNEIEQDVIPEQPTRIFKQLLILYNALKSLEENYPDEKAFGIIQSVIESSSNQNRVKVLNELLKIYNDEKISTFKLSKILKLGKNTLLRQLNILWNLGIVKKETSLDQFNRPMEHNWQLKKEWEEKYLNI